MAYNSTLYIIATPIGNLKDLTFRAKEVLEKVDLILAEDTRKAKILLEAYQIKKPLFSYHQYSRQKRINFIFEKIKKGKKIALISEAGTPGISDPGNELIEKIVKEFGSEVKITPLPGPCALIAALSISGLPASQFVFLGFPPKKKKREAFFKKIIQTKETVIFYESPYRIIKTLLEFKKVAQMKSPLDLERKIVVCRELTKKFETIYRGTISEIISQLKMTPLKGEFVIIFGPKPA